LVSLVYGYLSVGSFGAFIHPLLPHTHTGHLSTPCPHVVSLRWIAAFEAAVALLVALMRTHVDVITRIVRAQWRGKGEHDG